MSKMDEEMELRRLKKKGVNKESTADDEEDQENTADN